MVGAVRRGTLLGLMLLLPAVAAGAPMTRDVNGDGLADVGVADYEACGPDQAAVVFGSRDRTPPVSRDAPGERGFLMTAESCVMRADVIGDVDGDGLADVLTGADDAELPIVFGKRDTRPVRLIGMQRRGEGAEPAGDATISHGAGDVNGDGLADVIFSTGVKRHIAKVYLGGRGTPFRRSFLVLGAGRIRVGLRGELNGIGDFNGDGIGDFAAAVEDPDGRVDGFDVEELVFVVWGAKGHADVVLSSDRPGQARVTRRGRIAGLVLRHTRSCFCNVFEITGLGDLDGDGRDEMAVVYDSRTDILFGRRTAGTVTLPGKGGAVVRNTSFAAPVFALGRNLFVGTSNLRELRRLPGGRRHRFVDARNDTKAAVAGTGIAFGAPTGDVDGDGLDDVLLGWGGENQRWSIVYGASALAPVDLRQPAAGTVTRITGDGYPDETP
jgi:hypothetical protein